MLAKSQKEAQKYSHINGGHNRRFGTIFNMNFTQKLVESIPRRLEAMITKIRRRCGIGLRT